MITQNYNSLFCHYLLLCQAHNSRAKLKFKVCYTQRIVKMDLQQFIALSALEPQRISAVDMEAVISDPLNAHAEIRYHTQWE